ncbi:Uncharacterised protein [Klebsiella michiganensis]|nr:Uncharacterised protein [Klebsiella michiganensis]
MSMRRWRLMQPTMQKSILLPEYRSTFCHEMHRPGITAGNAQCQRRYPVDVASIVDPAVFSEIPGRRSLIAQSLDEVLFNAEEGTAARAADTRRLEEAGSAVATSRRTSGYQSEVANSQRLIDNLTEQRNQILSEEPAGKWQSAGTCESREAGTSARP